MDLMVAAFPWGSYLGEEALENGVDAMISSWHRAAPNTIRRQPKPVVTTYLRYWLAEKPAATAMPRVLP